MAEAVPVWRNALEKDPSDGRAHLNLAYSLIRTGQPRDAIAEYRKACDLSPDDPIAFAEFALALLQNGRPDDAIANYRKSLALDAGNAGVHADLGALPRRAGRRGGWARTSAEGGYIETRVGRSAGRLASALLKTGDTTQATAHFEKAVSLAPTSVAFRVGLAGAWRRPDACRTPSRNCRSPSK
ncbi:MAG: tetratricopeptide repeat protein [Ignavibacteriota bacterium]